MSEKAKTSTSGKPRVTIYHNPRCGTSRKVLAMMRDAGIEPRIIEYLKTPPTPAELQSLLKAMAIEPGDLLRTQQKQFSDAGLDASASRDDMIEAMSKHPVLIDRPIVVAANGTRLCRPASRVIDLLA